jgi:hypothetical protein
VCTVLCRWGGGGQWQWHDANKFVTMMTNNENASQVVYKQLLDTDDDKAKNDPGSVLGMLLNNFEDLWCRIVVLYR